MGQHPPRHVRRGPLPVATDRLLHDLREPDRAAISAQQPRPHMRSHITTASGDGELGEANRGSEPVLCTSEVPSSHSCHDP
jgi:hypothetical protein